MRNIYWLCGVLIFLTSCAGWFVSYPDPVVIPHRQFGRELSGDQRHGALQAALQALRRQSTDAQALTSLALAYHRLGHLNEALEYYQKALQVQPDELAAHHHLGILFVEQEQYAQALVHFEQVLQHTDYNGMAEVEAYKGWAHYKLGEVDQGVASVQRGLERQPTFCLGYVWLARLGLEGRDTQLVMHATRRY